MRPELHMQMILSTLDIFLGKVDSREHGMQEQRESSDTMANETEDLEC